jgi:hypothetical protein
MGDVLTFTPREDPVFGVIREHLAAWLTLEHRLTVRQDEDDEEEDAAWDWYGPYEEALIAAEPSTVGAAAELLLYAAQFFGQEHPEELIALCRRLGDVLSRMAARRLVPSGQCRGSVPTTARAGEC